jgi:hypothetical protein
LGFDQQHGQVVDVVTPNREPRHPKPGSYNAVAFIGDQRLIDF